MKLVKALVVTNKHKLELQDIDKPTVAPQKVLIKVAYCGICGSDLPRYFEGGVHSFPQVLGHEFSGVVEEIGEKVTNIKVGDRVAVAPLVPCGTCENCQKGEPAMCTNYSFIGSREQGAMAEYVVVPEKNCVKVPDSLSLKEAALVEPLTVAIHGIERINISAGADVLVLGAGTIGLLTVLSLRAIGVGKITVVDLNDKKLEVAKTIGADEVVNPTVQTLEDYYKETSLPEAVIETAGSSVTQKQAIEFVSKRGKVVYVGTSTKDVVLDPETFEKILRGELEVTGSWMSYSAPFPGYEWETGLRYMSTKQVDVKPLITGLYRLEDVAEPFDKMVEANSTAIKLLYAINEEK
ncbi:galactitol-1-phosphate 5-dehydrogenase [Enterococcus pallens]|uniref:Chlorophyll synthesis pathway protein BchC n=1 Tax=Enterococcus pallens ATCC BAA-351 TaxID=1158607 RepID=R2T2F7_9ENTE|nr:galactitol-1-phosphate 5-dehydrogenase [Enterococcus pallens]EOH94419.1 chlorophyll synthesis pathway protein BchC [Enterococcus pallens ATCC BAA-351]EOU24298.1 chlorophyll synthesis pathway protein BchC [Enterococcus pallens ATCC BAA-351]